MSVQSSAHKVLFAEVLPMISPPLLKQTTKLPTEPECNIAIQATRRMTGKMPSRIILLIGAQTFLEQGPFIYYQGTEIS